MEISITVNGRLHRLSVDPRERLVDLLRDRLGCTGVKEGCGAGECGACTVQLDGRIVASCLLYAWQADGASLVTVEGLAQGQELHPLQAAFIDLAAVQCGFCTPGMLLAAKDLLEHNPRATRAEIRQGLAGNLCRCTGYGRIVDAVEAARERMLAGAPGGPAAAEGGGAR